MSFEKVNYIDGETVITAKNLNDIQNELTDLKQQIDERYSKPSGGIPESDLSAAVQTKLNQGGGSEGGENQPTVKGYKWISSGYMRDPVRSFMGWPHNIRWDNDLGCAVGMVLSGDSAHTSKAPYHRVLIYPSGYMSAYEEVTVNYPDGENNDCGYINQMIRRDDGTYWMVDFYHRVFTSDDKCLTWNYIGTANIDNDGLFGATILSNGVWLGGNCADKASKVYRSTDGVTWSPISISTSNLKPAQVFPETAWRPFEPFFVEGENGKVIMYARASMNAFLTGSTDAHMRKEPAVYSVSNDYGQTWTPWEWSESIPDMTNNNGKYVVVDGVCHLVYGSRFGNNLNIYYSYAKIEDALNDKWSEPALIDSGHWEENAAFHGDGGYPSVWADNQDNIYAVYYDGDGTGTPGGASYRLLTSNPYVQHNAVSNFGGGSLNVAYSQKQVDLMIAKLQSKINNIIINNGGEVEDTLDGSYPVTKGMLAWYEMNSESVNPIESKVGNTAGYTLGRRFGINYARVENLTAYENNLANRGFVLPPLPDIGVSGAFAIEFTGKYTYVYFNPGVFTSGGSYTTTASINHYAGNEPRSAYVDNVVINISDAGYEVFFNGVKSKTGTDITADLVRQCHVGITSERVWINNIMVYDHCLSAEEIDNNLRYAKSVIDLAADMDTYE